MQTGQYHDTATVNTRHGLSLDRLCFGACTQWFTRRIRFQKKSLIDCFGKSEGSTQQVSRNHSKANDDQTAMVQNQVERIANGNGAIQIGHSELRGCLELGMTPEFEHERQRLSMSASIMPGGFQQIEI